MITVQRREYDISPITVNGIVVNKAIIDPHYEKKHGDHIDDDLILRLVGKLNGRIEIPEAEDEEFSYFVTLLELEERRYRLIWLLESDSIYIGVINAYRDDRSS